MLDLDDVRALVEVVESGGFSRAAERLGVTKSIVSRRIARLEGELGVRLLARTTRGVSPTAAGAELKLRSDRILRDVQEAEEAVAQSGGAVVGRLRVSVPLAFGVKHVAPILAELVSRHPKLSVDAVYTDRLVDLVAERFDAAIRIGVLQDSVLVARRIAPIRAVLLASPRYLAERGRPQAPGDLSAHECLIYTGTRQPQQWRFRSGKRWISVRVEGRLHSDNGESLTAAASAGLGIALLPSFLAAAGIENGTLEPVLEDFPTTEAALYVVRPPGPHVPGNVRALIDLLVERFGGEPYWDICEIRRRGGCHVPRRARWGSVARIPRAVFPAGTSLRRRIPLEAAVRHSHFDPRR